MPPGAKHAVVIDDRRAEHAAAVLHDAVSNTVIVLDHERGVTTEGWQWWTITTDAVFSEPLVRFTDAAGEIVAGPLGYGVRTRVEDATEPCPVCDAVAWVAVDTYVGCERCGYVPGHSVFYEPDERDDDGFDDDDEDDEEDEDDDCEEDEDVAALAAARFPIYAVVGQTPESFAHSRRGREVVSVQVIHVPSDESLLFVETRTETEPNASVADRLAGWLAMDGRDGSDLSRVAKQVWHADRLRKARRRAANAEPVPREFVADGQPHAFAFTGVDHVWLATREHAGVTLQVFGFNVGPDAVALAPLPGVGNAPEPRGVGLARRAAAGELLDRAEVSQLIDHSGLGEYREAILAGVRPGYRLQRVADSPHRVGGLPDLAPGEPWPHDEHGVPYTFIAQIDCSQLPPLESAFDTPAFNHGGQLLRLFGRMNGSEMVPDLALALVCAPDAPLTRAERPPLPDPMPPGVELEDTGLDELPEDSVRPLPFLTARYAPVGDFDRYHGFLQRLAAGGARPRAGAWDDPQLLGRAGNEQGSDPVEAGPWVYEDTTEDDWCVLLHLPAMDWGSLSVLIRLDDLAAGRFDRLATDLSLD